MNEDQMAPMEQDIITEENINDSKPKEEPKSSGQPQQNKKPTTNLLQGLKIKVLHLKKPKLLSLVILLFAIVVVAIGLNLMSTKNGKEVSDILPAYPSIDPSPQTSVDPNTQNVAQKVSEYTQKLDSLKNYQIELIQPIVNLDISFDK